MSHPRNRTSGRDVVVTGIGMVVGDKTSPEDVFDAVAGGETFIRDHEYHRDWGLPAAASAHVDPLTAKELQARLPAGAEDFGAAATYAWHAATQAWERSGLPSRLDERGGVFVACNRLLVETDTLSEIAEYWDHEHGLLDLDAYLDSDRPGRQGYGRSQPDTATPVLAEHFGATEIIENRSDACAAGGMAVGSGYRAIQDGIIDVALVGGTEALATFSAVTAFYAIGALAPSRDVPSGQISRPFDKHRTGFVFGEGASFLVLESREHAEARGADVLAVVSGYSGVLEAVKITSSTPDGSAYAECIRAGLADAGLTEDDVDHVHAHGTSTQANDASEAAALHRVFGARAGEIVVTSTKSAMGHSLANAGAAEAVLSVLSLQRDVVPPTLNFTEPDDASAGLDVATEARSTPLRTVLSTSFGFGGENCALVLTKERS